MLGGLGGRRNHLVPCPEVDDILGRAGSYKVIAAQAAQAIARAGVALVRGEVRGGVQVPGRRGQGRRVSRAGGGGGRAPVGGLPRARTHQATMLDSLPHATSTTCRSPFISRRAGGGHRRGAVPANRVRQPALVGVGPVGAACPDRVAQFTIAQTREQPVNVYAQLDPARR